MDGTSPGSKTARRVKFLYRYISYFLGPEIDYFQNFEKYGRPRQLAGDLSKIIKATKGRVDRFIRKLRIDDDEPILPELATHLEDFLKIDEVCIYHPETAIDWDLGKSIST